MMFVTGHLMSSELFPTGIRNMSFSAGQLFSRFGVILSPQIFQLAEIWPTAPYLVLMMITAVDFVIFWVATKETKGKPLVDHMPGKEEKWSSYWRKDGVRMESSA